jgi:hypothetical protein
MTDHSQNPLHKYFRVPGLNVRLPSGGKFLPEGSVDFAGDGMVAILPMRSADELLLKNADALMSGYAIEQMLASCVPSIKTPKLISSPDLDVLLLAVRAATYGDEMEVQANCPSCEHVNDFSANLPALLSNITPMPDETSVRLSDELVVNVRPYTFQDTTALSLATFQETRKVQNLEYDENATEEQRSTQLKESMSALTTISTTLMAGCVSSIVTPDEEVSDPGFVAEFMANIARPWSKKIEDKLKEMNQAGIDKMLPMTCQKCGHEWETTIEFDPASFFDVGS